jgi:hypothetical protein
MNWPPGDLAGALDRRSVEPDMLHVVGVGEHDGRGLVGGNVDGVTRVVVGGQLVTWVQCYEFMHIYAHR